MQILTKKLFYAETPHLFRLFLLSLFVALGANLRLTGLSEYTPMWDGAWHMLVALNRDSLFDVMLANIDMITHPPLFVFLLHGISEITRDIFFMRFTSLIPGLLIIFSFYYMGRQTIGKNAAVFLAFMAAFSYTTVYFSQELRHYTLMLLGLSISLGAAFALKRSAKNNYLVIYFFSAFIAVFSHYSAVIAVCATGIVFAIIFMQQHQYKFLMYWMTGNIILAILFCIHVYFHSFGDLFGFTSETYPWRSHIQAGLFSTVTKIGDVFMNLFDYFYFPPKSVLPKFLMALAIFGFFVACHEKRYAIICLVFSVVGLNVVMSFFNLYPLYGHRHSMFISMYLLIFPAIAIEYLSRKIHPLMLSSGIVGLVFLTMNLTNPMVYRQHLAYKHLLYLKTDDYLTTVNHLKKNVGTRDLIVTTFAVGLHFKMHQLLEHNQLVHIPKLRRGSQHTNDGIQTFEDMKYFTCDVYIHSLQDLRGCIKAASTHISLDTVENVWFVVFDNANDHIIPSLISDAGAFSEQVTRDRRTAMGKDIYKKAKNKLVTSTTTAYSIQVFTTKSQITAD